jgi:PPIC-type PPIASE domain
LNLRRVLREPLLHFLLIGFALFLYYGHVAPGNRDARRVVVGQAEVDDLVRQYQATWNRPPTPQELTGLVEVHVHDEILYREGQALGLDRDDEVIKRRVRQKMDVMSEEEIAHDAPTDADLSAYLQAHSDAFRRPALVSFEQILFGTTGPNGELERKIVAAQRALEHGADSATFGQPTMLPARLDEVGLDEVTREFGEAFARQLLTAPLGHWSGPITSGFGAHLVRVSALKPAELPPLQLVRTAVVREWENDQRRRALDGSYRKLRPRYDVVIEAKLPEGTRR